MKMLAHVCNKSGSQQINLVGSHTAGCCNKDSVSRVTVEELCTLWTAFILEGRPVHTGGRIISNRTPGG